MDLHDLAQLLRPGAAGAAVRFRQGTVSAIASDGALSVAIAGSATVVSGVKHLASLCPKIGAPVWLATDGADLFAIGTMIPTGPAYCGIERPTTQSVADATDTAANFTATPTLEADTHGMFAAGSPDRLTVKAPGVYLLTGNVSWPGNGTGLRTIGFNVNGVSIMRDTRSAQSVGTNNLAVAHAMKLAAGDYVQYILRQSSGAALNASGPHLTATWLRPLT